MSEVTVRVQKIKKDTVRTRLLIFGVIALLLLLASIFSEHLVPCDPYLQDLANAKAAPSAAHWFGTDRYGRDMLSRVIIGSRVSIFGALLLVCIVTLIGTAVGILSGWCSGKVDTVLMRMADIFLAFPGLVFAMAVAGVLGGGLQNAIIALAAVTWPKYARIARSQTLSVKELPFIKAAKLAGCGTLQIITRHILPNIIGPVLVTSVLDIGTGSGCIALALKHRFPHADVTAMDISTEALRIAQENAQELGLDIRFVQQNILEATPEPQKYDLIVSNPPYVCERERAQMERHVLDYEPEQALFVPDSDPLLFYRAIINYASTALMDGGMLAFETNREYATEVGTLMKEGGWSDVEVKRDVFNNERIVIGCLSRKL